MESFAIRAYQKRRAKILFEFLAEWAYDSIIQALPREKIMKKILLQTLGLTFVGVALAFSCVAQSGSNKLTVADKFTISAKAGGVGFTEGGVSIARADGKGGVLLKGDQIEIGDTVTTTTDGRAEILLNPGSYMRVGGGTTMKFDSTSLDDLRIELSSGTAIFEVFATEKFRVNVVTPREKLSMFKSGVYRVDLDRNGSGELTVTEGLAAVGGVKDLILVRSGFTASFGYGTATTIEKTSKAKNDALAKWSKSRAKDLANMTASLKNSGIQNSLLSTNTSWNPYGSFGLWVYGLYGYCFLPFGQGWYSPYGYGYGYWFRPHYVPPPNYQPPPPTGPFRDPSHRKPPTTNTEPPYVALDRQMKSSDNTRRPPFNVNDPNTRGNDSGRFSPPSFSSQDSYRSPPPPPPPPARSESRADAPAKPIHN